jgi:hypothetical protein|tara:strand:- start:28 stop:273 length:246 start_codon:yes stop_codon:yes gene_type:complete
MADTYSFKDLYLVDYRPGQGEMINYRNSRRRKGAMESVGCNCGTECMCGVSCTCSSEVCECSRKEVNEIKILKFKEWNKSE